ncbi:MAG: C45 family autoproteolytic acyltransferase/hydrolase [Promethearchaeota archaeon]
MFEVTLRGSYKEIGYQYGTILKKAGIEFPRPSDKALRFAAKVEQEVAPLIPNLIDEIQGVAEGLSLDYEVIRTYALTVGRSPGCTVFAIPGQYTFDGKTMFARNYDATPVFLDFTLFRTYPEGHLSHIGCCFDMLVGREDGINEAGVAIAVTGVHGVYTDKPGVWDYIPVRAVLDTCTSTDEGVVLLTKFPHFWTKNFIVADAKGKIAIVEAAQQHISVHFPQNEVGVITNHFVASSMQSYNHPEKLMHKTHQRYSTIKSWFESTPKPVHMRQVKCVLKDAVTGVCTNKTGRTSDNSFLTIWSWVARLGNQRFELAKGSPVTSTSRYKGYSF